MTYYVILVQDFDQRGRMIKRIFDGRLYDNSLDAEQESHEISNAGWQVLGVFSLKIGT